jgi:hypothetical protein
MNRGAYIKFTSILLSLALVLLYMPSLAKAGDNESANLIGFVFSEDGTTPVQGAVITLRNVSTGETFKSTGTDNYGVFKVQELEKGLYVMGVSSEDGGYNAENLIGIRSGKTEKVSVTLKTFDQNGQEAAEEDYKNQNKGEKLVGKVIDYEANTQIATVEIISAEDEDEDIELRKDDEIHVLAPEEQEEESETDFYQNVEIMTLNDQPINKATKGQIVAIYMEEDAVPGDLVYLVKRKGIPPIFLIPVGLAAVVGGVTLTQPDDTPDDVTKFRK